MGTTQAKPKKRPRPPTAQASPRPAAREAGTSFKSPSPTSDVKGRDVMISYSHQDIEVMRKVESALKAEGISVWVDENAIAPGTAFLREIGEAIVASHIFIVLLSADSVQSKYCQDEVSLAYISNKTIFALSIHPYEEISTVMDLGIEGCTNPLLRTSAGIDAVVEKLLFYPEYKKDHTAMPSERAKSFKLAGKLEEEIQTKNINFHVTLTSTTLTSKAPNKISEQEQIPEQEQQLFKTAWASSKTSALQQIRDFEVETCTKFIQYMQSTTNINSSRAKSRIQWDLHSLVPFIPVCTYTKECHFGKLRSHNRQKNRQSHPQLADHDCKRRNLVIQNSKKIGCPAKLLLQECVRFPQLKLSKIEPHAMLKAQKEIVRYKSSLTTETGWLIQFPLEKQHCKHSVGVNVNSFMWNLCRKYRNCIYASSTIAVALERNCSIERLWANEDLHEKTTVFIPWNPSGCHWVLLVVNIATKTLLYLDPIQFPCLTTNTLVAEAKRIVNILLKKFGTTITSVTSPTRTMQTDGSSCGALVCLYARLIMEEKSLCTPEPMATLRREIYNSIVGSCLSGKQKDKNKCPLCKLDNLDDWVKCCRCKQWMHCTCARIDLREAKCADFITCPRASTFCKL